MASENKKRKAKNCGGWGGALKEKGLRLKRHLFYNSAQRQVEKRLAYKGE